MGDIWSDVHKNTYAKWDWIDMMTKRYFTAQSAKKFARDFTEIIADNNGETHKDSAKGVHNLIRYIGSKD